MKAASFQFLAYLPYINDQWKELIWLLPLLVVLELVLSADNAIALAAIARELKDPIQQRHALNLGLSLAIVLRFCLIIAARWVLHFWPLQMGAALYLLWLCARHFLDHNSELIKQSSNVNQAPTAPLLWGTVVTLGLTDLAFSLDSVAAAIAISDRLAVVMAGGTIGVLGLRFTAGFFIRYLNIYSNLETAGYLAVALVGLRLLLRLSLPTVQMPEPILVIVVLLLFVWGFSQKFNPPTHEKQNKLNSING
uniref:DUF475 domain-containing protein n=1 Tax=Paulinella chromatophora TaxID=39717 RepID=B1X5N2_PAUCH|nr:hypothetical protein PCC_0841 [Paulinella chromatophora]ACB43251.1 hypothetical protein PCC_0841 [Paulinella chromatophora]